MAFAAKPFVWTYTNLHTYEDVCAYQFYRVYVKKDIPYVATPEMDWGNKVHEAMELRIGGGKPLPVEMQQWEQFAAPFDGLGAKVEMKLGITREGRPTGFFDKDVAGRGKVDVLVANGTSAAIFDHKTGSSKYESPFELQVHAMMTKAAMPHLTEINGCFLWLKENRVGTKYDLSDFGGTWAKVNNLTEEIEDRMQSGDWPKRRNPLCGYCRVGECENNSNPKVRG